MNDETRKQWIANDEGLYNWHRSSRLPLRKFIRENRAEIDAVINNVTTSKKPAHYLTYGGEHRARVRAHPPRTGRPNASLRFGYGNYHVARR